MPSALHAPRPAGAGARPALLLMALAALAALGVALFAQHRLDMQPCPWCIFQRVLLLALAVAALLGAAWPARLAATLGALGVLVAGAGGLASAVFQHLVAAQQASCALTLADRFLMATGLEEAVPWLFQVTATCMDAAGYRLLGLGFEVWSGALFTLLALAAAAVLRGLLRRR